VALFVKAQANTTYQYKTVLGGSSAQAWLNSLNAQGSSGYLYKTSTYLDQAVWDLFVKSSSRNTTYSYRLEAGSYSLRDINANGAEGYAYWGDYFIGGTYRLYVKDNGGSSTFVYVAKPEAGTLTALLSEMNSMGSQYYSYKSPLATSTGNISLYERNSANTVATTFIIDNSITSTYQQSLNVMNGHAATGYYYWGDMGISSFFYKGPPLAHPLSGPIFP
jgi:hypothetical protein